MIVPLNKIIQAPGFYIRAALCIFVSAAVGCGLEVLEMCISKTESDYQASFLFIHWGALAFVCISGAAALTLIAVAIYTKGTKCAARVTGIYAVCLVVDAAVKYFTARARDGRVLSGRSGYDAILSIVSYISDFLVAVAIAFGVWIVSAAFLRVYKAREGSRSYSLYSAVNAAILLYFAVPFVRLIVKGAAELVSVNWRPSVTVIRSLVYEGVEICICYAIIAFIGSRITLAICTRKEVR